MLATIAWGERLGMTHINNEWFQQTTQAYKAGIWQAAAPQFDLYYRVRDYELSQVMVKTKSPHRTYSESLEAWLGAIRITLGVDKTMKFAVALIASLPDYQLIPFRKNESGHLILFPQSKMLTEVKDLNRSIQLSY